MRTTLQLNDHLYRGAKQMAAQTHRTLTQVVEDALRVALAPQKSAVSAPAPELPTFKGRGLRPGLDLDDSSALLDAMEAHGTAGR